MSFLSRSRAPVSRPEGGLSYWHRLSGGAVTAAGGGTASSERLPACFDFAVVGGGFAGLSSALALADAEPAAAIVLFEANGVGFGASGRNAGLLSPLPAPVWLLTADQNPEHAWALGHINGRVHKVAAALAVDAGACDLVPVELRLQALGRLTATGLARVGRTLRSAGIEHASGPGTGGYFALDLPTHTIDPYRAVLALAARARGRGITIAEHMPVQSVSESGDGVRVVLAGGREFSAGRAIVCTNAYTGGLTLPETCAAKVVYNFMVAAPHRAVAGEGKARFVVELNTAYVYYRQHRDHVLFGGIERFKPYGENDFAVPPDVLASLEGLLGGSFPGAALAPAVAWGGRYHQTSTDLPTLSAIGANGRIVMNVGYGGTGVAMSMISAPLAAALARDKKFASADDRRLYDAIRGTRVPVAGLARLVFGVARDVVLGRSPSRAQA